MARPRPAADPKRPELWVIHPLLLAAYPVVFLYTRNLPEQITIDSLLNPLLVVLAITAFVQLLWFIGLRDLYRAGLATSLLVALVFSFGHVGEALQKTFTAPGQLLAVWAVIACFGIVLITQAPSRIARGATRALNVVAVVLVVTNVVPIIDYQLHNLGDPTSATAVISVRAGTQGSVDRRPDIYFIILDRYAGAETLDETYGFDNSEFLDALRDRGFYVADDALANYTKTAMSITSTLSLDYLDREALLAKAESPGDYGPLHELLQNGEEVQRFLKSQGYTYVHLGSWWGPTWQNKLADVTYRYGSLSEFGSVLYASTVLPALDDPWQPPEPAIQYWRDRCKCAQNALYQFDRLPKIAELRGPKFVFAHILFPHDPYVIDRYGNLLTEQQANARSRELNYTDQVRYANSRMLPIIDHLLAGPDGSDPVIILAADEGPFPVRYAADQKHFDWREATLAELEEKYRILDTFYLPGVEDPATVGLHRRITPVNTFRIVFNTY
ncbi:MAG: hypothetical protein M3295_09775, partial [Chloroflexota bacterium]|nr:hypothetical protein [Chloroflexota bacterium]